MTERKADIKVVTEPWPIKRRKIDPQNIVIRLRQRETIGSLYPGTQVYVAKQFYQNVFPNFSVVNVEKPPCVIRKFSPDGKHLIAFSADQTSIEIYRYRGAAAAGELLAECRGEVVGHRNDQRSFEIRNKIFGKFFRLVTSINIAQFNEQLNRDCSLFTDDGNYLIVASAAQIPDDLRPHFYQIYTNNEALTPNPRYPLEDYSIHLVDLEKGRLCDTRHFKTDKIYFNHNQGLYLYNDVLAVLSVQHQTIHIFQLLDGMFINVRTIGRFCLEDEGYLVACAEPHLNTRPFREITINSLKHKLLVYLYKRAAHISRTKKDPYELRRFYQYFDHLNCLKMWKMQLLDTDHILIRYASEEVTTLQEKELNAHQAILVVYNMVTAKILAAYDNASTYLLTQFENFTDCFRNARMGTDGQYMCSPSNNVYARLLQQRVKQTLINSRGGGVTEATKRLLSQLPICAQSFSCSPYLDYSLFCYDDKYVSMVERPRPSGDNPIRFYARDSGILKFRINPGMVRRLTQEERRQGIRRMVVFTFHPTDPFAISVHKTATDYIVSFHIRHE